MVIDDEVLASGADVVADRRRCVGFAGRVGENYRGEGL